jgi:hypothetical protein
MCSSKVSDRKSANGCFVSVNCLIYMEYVTFLLIIFLIGEGFIFLQTKI